MVGGQSGQAYPSIDLVTNRSRLMSIRVPDPGPSIPPKESSFVNAAYLTS